MDRVPASEAGDGGSNPPEDDLKKCGIQSCRGRLIFSFACGTTRAMKSSIFFLLVVMATVALQAIAAEAASENEETITLTPLIDHVDSYPGEEFSFSVMYKNGSDSMMHDAFLKIILPVEVEFLNASGIPAMLAGSHIDFSLGRLEPRAQGIVAIRVKVKELVEDQSALLFNAFLEYRDDTGKFRSISTFAAVTVKKVFPSFSAAMFGGMSSQWLFWFVATLGAGFLGGRLYTRRRNNGKIPS